MNVNDIVAAKVEAARLRIEAAKKRRAALNAARQRGLAHRHAAKLRNLSVGSTDGDDRGPAGTSVNDTTDKENS